MKCDWLDRCSGDPVARTRVRYDDGSRGEHLVCRDCLKLAYDYWFDLEVGASKGSWCEVRCLLDIKEGGK